jgi:hypothetical protein
MEIFLCSFPVMIMIGIGWLPFSVFTSRFTAHSQETRNSNANLEWRSMPGTTLTTSHGQDSKW